MSYALAFLQALPAILKLIQSMVDYATLQQGKGIGRAEAINEALTRATEDLDRASAAIREAQAHQSAHPNDDDGFDTRFRRN